MRLSQISKPDEMRKSDPTAGLRGIDKPGEDDKPATIVPRFSHAHSQ